MAAKWTPLESNPEVLTKYLTEKLGVSKNYQIVDVLGLDEDLLAFIPQPVKSVILLFPCSESYESHRAKEDEVLRQNPPSYPSDLFYMKQTVHNACGTVALVHSILNNLDSIQLNDGILKSYYDKAAKLSPEERGKLLENDEAFTTSHQELAQEGQTAADPNEEVNHHFIALTNKNGTLYELDGRKSFPVEHGSTTPETLLKDAINVCKEFMARDPAEIRFTILALVPNEA